MYEKIKEVKILGEGWQLIRLACRKHKLTKEDLIKKYAEMTGNYENSIASYFEYKIIGVEKFREFLEKDLGKPYEELIQTVENQLKTYIEGVRDNIYLYNEGEDGALLKQLIEETRYFKMPYLEIIAMGNLGRFKANLRLNDEAIVILYDAIDLAKERGYWDLVLYYHTNIAYVENLMGKHPEARKRLRKLEKMPEEYAIDNKMVVHQYWYIYAYTMSSIGQKLFPTARKKFKKAMEYAESIDNEVKCLVNIAWLYVKEQNYKKTMDYYEKALGVCTTEFHIRAIVLNNIANYYIVIGDTKTAREYINKAIDSMPKDISINPKIAIFDTYVTLEEDCDKIMTKLIQSLKESSRVTENRQYVYSCVDTFIGKLRKGRRYKKLIQLEDALIERIEREVREEDKREFKVRLGEIGLILKKEGGYLYEKENSSNDFINPND